MEFHLYFYWKIEQQYDTGNKNILSSTVLKICRH